MDTSETRNYSVERSLDNGIERITYIPQQPRFKTPIFMQHGMWHGAWCWQRWQELFAEWGWESHAISLPGHAGSPAQRPVWFCTLDYYLKFLKAEIERLERLPVLMGHSMGGALTQWYFKYVSDELPAAVLVAPWESHSVLGGYPGWVKRDPLGVILATLTLSANPFIRTPQRAAKMLISEDATYTPEEFHARLSSESLWVMLQHNPPFWFPPKQVRTPLLWLAGEMDATISLEAERRSAAYYQADFHPVPGSAHNLMMEHSHQATAETIHHWLREHNIK
jgi:pimeloyl-ACP methyl ester carboxylesterase